MDYRPMDPSSASHDGLCVRAPLARLLQRLHRVRKPKPCQRAATKTASPQKPLFCGDQSRMGEGKAKKVAPRGFLHPNILQKSPWISQTIPTALPESIPIHPDPIVSRLLLWRRPAQMEDRTAADPPRRGAPVPGGGGSGPAPQDPATSASSSFAWQGGPPTGSLGALLAAAGAPPGVSAGAWPGFPAAGAWPFFPGARVPTASAGADGVANTCQVAGSRGGSPTLAGLPTGAWPPSAAMAGGGTSPALHGGLPDWFVGAATAALGSEWLRADLGTPGGSTKASSSTTKEVPSQAIDVDEERLPVRASSGPIRGSSAYLGCHHLGQLLLRICGCRPHQSKV
jgi:hypothetical protein